jgi:hypothetical protein
VFLAERLQLSWETLATSSRPGRYLRHKEIVMSSRLFSFAVTASLMAAAACGTSSPVGPTSQPKTVELPAPVSVAAVVPVTGSTGGSTPVKITGSGFQAGATVMLGGVVVEAMVVDGGTIRLSTTAHAAGLADVVVTNPDGGEGRLAGAFSFVPPSAFDFNGEWAGAAGSELELELGFTVAHGVLVGVSCGSSGPVTFSPSPAINYGEFSIVTDRGTGISARIVSASDAVGTINLGPCQSMNWIARRVS